MGQVAPPSFLHRLGNISFARIARPDGMTSEDDII